MASAIIFDYYANFIPYYSNLFSPLFVFIAVIFFTSKLAGNSEIISMMAAGVSIRRLMRPYMISCVLIAGLTFYLNSFCDTVMGLLFAKTLSLSIVILKRTHRQRTYNCLLQRILPLIFSITTTSINGAMDSHL